MHRHKTTNSFVIDHTSHLACEQKHEYVDPNITANDLFLLQYSTVKVTHISQTRL